MTWSVATPTWVAPCSSIISTMPSTPRAAATSMPSASRCDGHGEVVAEQLVGAVDEVHLERGSGHPTSLAHLRGTREHDVPNDR